MLEQLLTFYTESYGGTIIQGQETIFKAYFSRAISAIQNKLGWSLSGGPTIQVLGVNPGGCDCGDMRTESLDPAPAQKGQYRIFNLNAKAPNALVDPFTKVHHVYICKTEPEGRFISSANNEVVILAAISNFTPRYFLGEYGKYIQSCPEMGGCANVCASESGCSNCTSLLVDADWVTFPNIPQDFLFLLCDYVDWLRDGGTLNAGISSESVDGHSVSYGNKTIFFTPFDTPDALAVISDFAGPFGKPKRQQYIW